ncbi:hypothetical protein OK016_11910 [Vibrio chagasii]|nr:hypothetical protein [Vibrio chagasii]
MSLEDGTVFHGGEAIGALLTVLVGEVVFNTSMTGTNHHTDPSYSQQIVTLTYLTLAIPGPNPKTEESPLQSTLKAL